MYTSPTQVVGAAILGTLLFVVGVALVVATLAVVDKVWCAVLATATSIAVIAVIAVGLAFLATAGLAASELEDAQDRPEETV